jgi:hypothetical protein
VRGKGGKGGSGEGGKGGGRGKWGEMTQTLYAHMNKIKVKRKKYIYLYTFPALRLCSFVKDQLTQLMWVYLRALYYVPLVSFSIFSPIRKIGYYSIIVAFEIR